MSIRKRKFGTDRLGDYDRLMLRSAFVSLFWAALKDQGRQLKFLAKELRVDKSAISRWFSSSAPNFQIDTISDIARALDLEISITARPRNGSPKIYTPSGVQETPADARSKVTVTENPNPPVQSRIIKKPTDFGSPIETTGDR
jgi:transcriptional regulator with XRE-family HTH domain